MSIMSSNIQKEIQKQQSKQVYSISQDRKISQNWYLKIIPITVGNNSWIIISKTSIFSITLLICLYYALFSYQRSDKNSIETFKGFFSVLRKQSVNQFLIIISLSSEFYVLQSILLLHVKKMHNIPLLSSINQAFDIYLLVIIQLNILLSYINFLNEGIFALKIVCFVIANLTVIFSDFFLMPKNNPSDFLYTIETSFMVLFRCSFIVAISATLIDYYISSSFVSPAVSLMLIITLSYEFSLSGALAYNNQTSSMWFYVSYALLMTINATILLKLFMPIGPTTPAFLFFIVLFKIYTSFIGYENNPIFDNYLTLNDLKAFMAINLSMNEGISVIRKSLLIGLIQIHRNTCMSKNCISQRSSVIQQKQRIKPDNLFADQKLETTIFYYTKCLFELLLDKNSSDVATLICYCEYLLYEMKMIFPLLIPISKLGKYKLNVSQQIRFQNIKDTIKEYLNKQNQVNHPKLIFQEVISLQNTCFTLKQAADQIINKNIDLWRSFNRSISQAQILDSIQQILDLKKTIKANLANSVHFHRHLGLKRLISFFKLYLNNDFKRQREISALSSSLLQTNQSQINKPIISPIQPIIKAQDCFSPNSIFILAKFSLQKILIIQKVSKSASNLLGYEQNELNEVQLSTVLPDYLKQKHKQLMISLIDQGFTSNQKSLKAIDTQCLKKDSSLVSVCKSFKTYADMHGQVRFACILKVDPIQPIIIISSMKNKILQSSSNLQRFFVQQEYNEKQGLSNVYNDILELIKSQKQNNKKFEQEFAFMTNRTKQLKFRVKKIEYEAHQPIFSITIIIPQQPAQMEYISQSTQTLKANVQIDFKEQSRPLANIFMKEQNFIPAQNLPKMTHIKRSLYIFGVIYLISPTIVGFFFQHNCLSTKDYFDMKVFFIKSLKAPSLLGVLYYQIQMKIEDDIEHILLHAKQYQNRFIKESLNPHMLKTIFDKSIFKDAYIQIEEYSDNGTQLLSFDSKDIFFSIGSFISSNKGLDSQFSLHQFNKFNQMMIPFFRQVDNIKDRLLQAYSQLFQALLLPDITSVGILITIFTISLVVFCYNFHQLFEVWTNLIKLISTPSDEQYFTSFTYWQELKMLLSPQQSYSKLKTCSYAQAKNQTKQQLRYFDENRIVKSRLLPSGIIAMVIMLLVILNIEYLKFIQIRGLRQFQQHGTIILEEYPKGIVFSYCLLQRHYNQTVLKIIDLKQEVFQSLFKQFKQFSPITYLATPKQQNSQFYQLYKQYFFDNPCRNISRQAQAEDFTYQKCSAYAKGRLATGIISFERYVSNMIQKVIQNSIVFQKKDLSNLIQSLVLANYFIEQLLRVWSIEYHQRLENLIRYTFFLNLISTSISVIIFYFFISRNFISKITVLQELHKQAYSILMTKDIIQRNKIAQTQLTLCGFLEKK